MNMLDAWEVQAIRAALPKQARVIEYGVLEAIQSTGRATCRECGLRIQKGEKSYRFFWDFNGCGSWTAQQVQIHETCPETVRR